MKIAIITCYDQNDYVRARTLRTAFAAAPNVELQIIRNHHKGLLRYIEVPLKILKSRLTSRPDAYVITFRGYEMMLFMALTLLRKPIIFDEMVNFTEWMAEHQVLKPGSLAYKLFRWWNSRVVGHARIILADTDAHAQYSAQLNRLSLNRYTTVPVGTDESIFFPREPASDVKQPFTVFYYGNIMPLHGLQYVLEAAVQLKDHEGIAFHIVGGKQKTVAAVEAAQTRGARISYDSWIPFEELPAVGLQSGLTVGGPFGGTTQAQYVITGKTFQFLALGAPILVGRNQVNEGFIDKKNCLLVPQADAAAIADAILWASEHPSELHKIAQNGRSLYEQHFSQAVINELVADLVGKLS